VVVGPQATAVEVRSAQIVGLSATMATVVVVLGNGSVESEPISLADDVGPAHLAAASAHLAAQLTGHSLGTVTTLRPSGDDIVDRLCADALAAVRDRSSDEHVYMGGTAAMASAFDAVDIVRDVLRALEQQIVVVSLIGDLVDRGLSVAIGGEHGVEPLAACSVIVAPILVEGEHLGSVGVLGPTRMNYPQAMATVEVVSDQLGRRLEDN
jgi:heat-inducible transcriptional repressor